MSLFSLIPNINRYFEIPISPFILIPYLLNLTKISNPLVCFDSPHRLLGTLEYQDKKNTFSQTPLEESLPTMDSSSRDLFTKYLEGQNWMQIGYRIRLNSIRNYFTWDCRFNNKFIYDYINKKLLIEKTIQEDSVQPPGHLQSYQGKIINSESNNTKRFRNVEQFNRSVKSVQSSIVDTYENRNFNRRNWSARNRTAIDRTLEMNTEIGYQKHYFDGLARFDCIHCIMMCLEEFI